MKYSLDIISHRPESSGKSLRKFQLDGVETVGAFGDEPYAIVFRNRTPGRVEVKLSVDGTDVLSGERATSDATGKRWVVEPWASMELRAWPETTSGGGAFVFGRSQDAVAAHTHGDLSSLGYIAAAVFRETAWPNRYGLPFNGFRDSYGNSTSVLRGMVGVASLGASHDAASTIECNVSSPGTGVGQHVEQHIGTTQGIRLPTLDEIVRVRYLWWDDVVAKLKSQEGLRYSAPSPGFPGDRPLIDLGSTPRRPIPSSGFKPQRGEDRIQDLLLDRYASP